METLLSNIQTHVLELVSYTRSLEATDRFEVVGRLQRRPRRSQLAVPSRRLKRVLSVLVGWALSVVLAVVDCAAQARRAAPFLLAVDARFRPVLAVAAGVSNDAALLDGKQAPGDSGQVFLVLGGAEVVDGLV